MTAWDTAGSSSEMEGSLARLGVEEVEEELPLAMALTSCARLKSGEVL